MKIKLTEKQYNRLLVEEASEVQLDSAGVVDGEEIIDFSEKMKPGGVAIDFIREFIKTHPLYKWEAGFSLRGTMLDKNARIEHQGTWGEDIPLRKPISHDIDVYYIKDKKVMNKKWVLKDLGEYSGQDYALDRPLWDKLYQFTQIGGLNGLLIDVKTPERGLWDKIRGVFNKSMNLHFDSASVQRHLEKLIEDEIKEHGQIKWYNEFDEADFKMLANILYDIYMKKVEDGDVKKVLAPTEHQRQDIQSHTSGPRIDYYGNARNQTKVHKPQKFKVTESQYKRLIKEDSQDFGRLTDKVTPFIVKLFKLIENKLPSESNITEKILFLKGDMALPINEALIVAYTYEQFYKENITNWDNLIGEPLQYKGIYSFTGHVPMTADMWARGYGQATIYTIAGSREDALEKARNEDFIVDDGSIDDANIDWDTDIENIEVQKDMLADNLHDSELEDGNPFQSATDINNYMIHGLILQDKLTPH